MKKAILIIIFLFSGFVFEKATAQVQVRLDANIGLQPLWGPEGYEHVEYYYMPDIDAFYYVPNRQYIYLERGRWVFAKALPVQYHNFDLYKGYKVVVNDYQPYRRVATYRTKYAPFKGHTDQIVIRNSQNIKYFENKEHPQHRKWQNENNSNKNVQNNGQNKPQNKGNNSNRNGQKHGQNKPQKENKGGKNHRN